MSCGIGQRCGLDPVLLWLWRRLVSTVPIWPLAWEPPCATGVDLKRQKKKKLFLRTYKVAFLFHVLFCICAVSYKKKSIKTYILLKISILPQVGLDGLYKKIVWFYITMIITEKNTLRHLMIFWNIQVLNHYMKDFLDQADQFPPPPRFMYLWFSTVKNRIQIKVFFLCVTF